MAGAAVHKLDEPDTALNQPSRDDTGPAEAVGLATLHAIERERGVVLLREIEDLARLGLHVEGGLERADPGSKLAVLTPRSEMALVQRAGQSELQLLDRRLFCPAVEVRDRFLAGHDADALVVGREEVVVEDLRAGVRRTCGDGDERRQVLVHGAKPVADP